MRNRMKLSSAKQSANILLSIIKLYMIMACVNAQAITFNELLAQANLWQPQHCQPREDLIVKEVLSPTANGVTTRITLRPTHRPTHHVGKIAYVTSNDKGVLISHLEIAPEYQRAGIGSVLIGAVLETCRKAGACRVQLEAQPLSTDDSWPSSYQADLTRLIEFYKKNRGELTSLTKLYGPSKNEEYLLSARMKFDLTRDQQ